MKFIPANFKIEILYFGFLFVCLLLLLAANSSYLESNMVDILRIFYNERVIKQAKITMMICVMKCDLFY
jgi:hypothetical protein